MSQSIFVLQCKKCKTVVADSNSVESISDQFYFVRHVHFHKKVANTSSEPYSGAPLPVVEFENCLSSNLICLCGFHFGMYLHSVPIQFNGNSGLFVIPSELVTLYNFEFTLKSNIRTTAEIDRDVMKIKKYLSKIDKMHRNK